jgi:homoprotocatechuate degradation regulator HpaR
MSKDDQIYIDDGLLLSTDRAVPMVLLRAREAVMQHFRPIFSEAGITEQQWRVLRVVYEAGTIDASTLAASACLLPPSLTRMLKLLDEKKWLAVSRDEADGRRIVISSTPEGRAFVDAFAPKAAEVYSKLVSAFGAEKVAQLVDLLNELEQCAENLEPAIG